jgi:large subunit ribosomal protein L13
MKIIDGNDLILGRLGSHVAKDLLKGENIIVINAEKIVISGKSDRIVEKYKKRRTQKDKANPEHSPHWPRRPDLLVKRVIRGMLPFDRPRGKTVFKNLKVYMGVPDELNEKNKETYESFNKSKLNSKYITVEELCKRLGY